jgi:outer membrane protein OmpA-like peptidoglycan-associated protein
MKKATREYVFLCLILSLVVGVSMVGLGCSGPMRPVALEQARTAYVQAQQDSQVATHAPVALRQAEEAVNRAEQTWQEHKDTEEAQHLAALAERRVEIARATAEKNMAEANIQELNQTRERVLLEARTREAQRAQQQAAQAQQQVRSVTAQNQQLAQELANLKARETNRGLVLTLGDVLFNVNQATLTPGAMHSLTTLVTFLKEHPERRVTIEGYTDSTGSEAYNLVLSQRRAEAVRNFLIQNGVEISRLTATGYGEASPIAPNTTEAGRLQNRRVEVVIS